MEVIQNVNELDINSSILRLNRSITRTYEYYQNILNNNDLDLEQKKQLVLQYSKQISIYNKVLSVLSEMIKEYCNDNKMTLWLLAMSKWEKAFNTRWDCTSDNNPTILESTPIIECTVCNTAQSVCKVPYGDAIDELSK